ncbi:MAG: 4Fe-4S binding protein [Candidatus Bathyarchaeota archaeon]|nr:4Fe-4S binding protein [Candidatus Bathyarchaeota archaeon]
MSHRKLGYRFPNDWTIQTIHEQRHDYLETVTIPVNIKIETQHHIYDFHTVDTLLQNAKTIVIQDCPCRTRRKHCDAPQDVCILLDERADITLQRNTANPKQVTTTQAREILRRAHDTGLVLTSILRVGDDSPKTICNCCSCCCYSLAGIVRFGLHNLVIPSEYIADDDDSLCTHCGICVDRCQFAARTMENGSKLYDPSKCLGCGLCVSTCPAQSIAFTTRSQKRARMRV